MRGISAVESRKSVGGLAAVVVVSLALSGCVLPPVVTAVSFGADIFSLADTGKTVSDHGISLVMQRDCAIIRALNGELCKDYAPSEDTPEGALVALAALGDPVVNPAKADPMAVPPNLAYLDGALGLAVASGPAPARDLPAPAFASLRDEIEAGDTAAVRDGFGYLAAGIEG